jgi:hypothetical protein
MMSKTDGSASLRLADSSCSTPLECSSADALGLQAHLVLAFGGDSEAPREGGNAGEAS